MHICKLHDGSPIDNEQAFNMAVRDIMSYCPPRMVLLACEHPVDNGSHTLGGVPRDCLPRPHCRGRGVSGGTAGWAGGARHWPPSGGTSGNLVGCSDIPVHHQIWHVHQKHTHGEQLRPQQLQLWQAQHTEQGKQGCTRQQNEAPLLRK